MNIKLMAEVLLSSPFNKGKLLILNCSTINALLDVNKMSETGNFYL
jgi:hypothetical protein